MTFTNKDANKMLGKLLDKQIITGINNDIIIGSPLTGDNIAMWEYDSFHLLRFNFDKIATKKQLRDDIAHELCHAFLFEQEHTIKDPHGIEFCTLGAQLLLEHGIDIFCNSCTVKNIIKGIKTYYKIAEAKYDTYTIK